MIKIIQNDKVIDVVKFPSYIKFLKFGHIAMTDKSTAQGVLGSDNKTVYSFTPVAAKTAGVATVKEISQTEFDRLYALLINKQEISADETALAEAKKLMIRKLSNICKNKITAGFSLRLSDGNIYSFKLTTEDQVNLMLIENQMFSGVETFIYHATDQPCKFYNKEDMLSVLNAFKKLTLYHTTYFNAAKQYINSLVDIEKVNLFSYGDDVTSVIDDSVLKQILKSGGNF